MTRALPDPDLGSGDSVSHQLIRRISGEGPIPLAEYMAAANSAYYASRDPLGQDGDFITAPEISQMFGEIIGVWCADLMLRSASGCHFVELGPGRGTLAADAQRVMRQFGCHTPLHFVETSPILRAKQAGLHPDAVWHQDIAALPDDAPLLIIANEFFDALPVAQYVSEDGHWWAQMVTRNRARFALVRADAPCDELVPIRAADVDPGTIFETSPVAAELTEVLTARLAAQGGAMLVIDYGYDAPGIGSTLQAVQRHLPVHPLDHPGDVDLTAHVDFGSIRRIAARRLLNVHGPVGQGQWLTQLGIGQRAKALAKASPDNADSVAAALRRLCDVEEMGRLFQVLSVTSRNWPDPEGFSYRS
ncbi:MAG: SAM-dependent methyltransferase [Parasphingorhabdus sp.]|nr:SAM-dependent methyltransferase [Parasphingorhabdus sp.]